MKKIKGVLVLVALLGYNLAVGQSIVSPYSILGIGDLSFDGLIHNQAMGEIGVGHSSVWHINHRNPAWLYRNSFSSFQIGMEGEVRRFATPETFESNGTGGLRYLSISLPIISKRLSTNFGILPFSTVNYNITTNRIVEGTDVNASTNFNGSGGLTQLFFSNGFRVYKEFAIGLKARYVFGSINTSNAVIVNDPTLVSRFQTRFIQSTTYNDLNLQIGLSYRKTIKENHTLSFGLTHDLSAGLSGKREERAERRDIVNDRIVENDILASDKDVLFEIPSSTEFGISYEKLNNFSVAIDVSMRNWTDKGGFENSVQNLRNSTKVSLGGEFIPKFNDVNSYFKRATYRTGISYEQLPYLLNNRKINDFGINFGTSFPVGGVSSLDVALKIGQRGTTEDDLIRETYVKFVFGATINDRWFIRRKYN